MANDTIQNMDEPQDNPTIPSKTVDRKLPKDPKIIILALLISLIIILTIAALIVSATKNNRPSIKREDPAFLTPTTSTNQPIPSTTPFNSQIPEEFKTQFDEIEKEYNNLKNLLPPQIDAEIGLETK